MNKLVTLLLTFSILAISEFSHAQELNMQVNVIAPQVSNVEKSIFETLESTIQEFMNGRKWTNDYFDFDERIECNMQITISEAANQTQFRGSIQIQSSRPIYNSDYKSALLSINDQNVEFTYLTNSIIQWSLDQHRDNLSSILAYYAYMILGTDYDSYSMDGGTEYYLKAQTIVANAQTAPQSGWKASEGNQNRFALVENVLSQTFKPLRICLYRYHRLGLDIAYNDADAARIEMSDALLGMRNIHKIRPSSYNLAVFFFTKSDEIVNIFGPAPEQERIRLYNLLSSVDPGNITKYEKMMD